MIVTADLVERITGVIRDCEEAIVSAYRARPGNPNQIEFASFGKILAMRVPFIPFFNRVYGFTADQAEHLPAIIDFYKTTNTRFVLWLPPEAVDEKLARLLAGQGFTPWGCHAFFYSDIDGLLPAVSENKVVAGKVGAADQDDYLETVLAGWGLPPEHREQARENMRLRFGIPSMHFFLGRLDGKTLGGAVFYQKGDIGYLADAATPLAHRGLGCQRKLLEARINFAREQGCRLIVGGAYFGSPSFRNMQRIGLKIAFTDMAWHYVAT